MSKKVLKLVHQEAVIKVWGAAGTSETITLADLIAPGQVVSGTPTVNIVGVTWTGQNETVITVTRAAERVLTLPSTGSSTIDFSGQALPPDSVENTSDLVIAITGGVGEIWIKLRKIEGYATTVEPEQFGPYDNPLVAGA